jgi:two-component sensor histidine kinase
MFVKEWFVKVIFITALLALTASGLVVAQNSPVIGSDDLMFKLRRDLKLYNEAVANNDSVNIAEASYLLAKRHINLGNYGIAQTWLFKALYIRKKFNHFEDIGKIYLRLQEIQFILESASGAIFDAKMAMLYFKKAASSQGVMSAYQVLGTSYLLAYQTGLKKTQTRRFSSLHKSINYFNIALSKAKILGASLDQGQAYRYLALCAEFENKPAESILLRTQAWEIDLKNGLLENSIELAFDLVATYLRIGNLPKAKEWLDQTRILAKSKNLKPSLQINLMEASARYHELKGNWKTALGYRAGIATFKDSAFVQYRNQAVEGVQKSEQAKLRETVLDSQRKQMALLKKNALLKNRILYAGSSLLFVFVFAAFLYGKLYWKYKKLSHYKTLLIKEQSHRTKNDLQAVSNLLSLQLFQVKDQSASKLLEESLMRVESIVLIHQRLYQDTTPMFVQVDLYLKDLTDSILNIYNRTDVAVSMAIDPFYLSVEKMVPFALIVNELTTNACKYAFGGMQPTIRVQCHLNTNSIEFLCEDNGPGFSEKEIISGFGMELIEMMTQQLGGKMAFESRNGCLFNLSFPFEKSLVQFPVAHQKEYFTHA